MVYIKAGHLTDVLLSLVYILYSFGLGYVCDNEFETEENTF